MELCLNSFDSADRFDDGITVDYAFMIRMWGAFDAEGRIIPLLAH